mmetsp:Transcript_21287/g.32153  ORF Transcript_21287/g.32153 Transcript_21287/m.32153 type:complete len:343 (+) Transcript_21287:103-1131(+)
MNLDLFLQISQDNYKAVQGDSYHGMNRFYIPMRHSFKKKIYVALKEAWFAWEPRMMQLICNKMKNSGDSEEDVKKILAWSALPSSKLYWRVRACISLYGKMICPNSGKPLFNDEAWKKARNLLKEIIEGYYSDIPGETYYRFLIDEKGRPVMKSWGFQKIECCRGTNRTEAVHRQYCATFRNWQQEVIMSYCLLFEFTHRFNSRTLQRKITGFPSLGMYDTWLIDLLQNLIQHNHGVVFCSNWMNASEIRSTKERHCIISLDSTKLGKVINYRAKNLRSKEDKKRVSKNKRFESQYTEEQKFHAKMTKLIIPILPFTTEKEYWLFNLIMRENGVPLTRKRWR